jgi:hypothetical protein
MPRKSQFTDEQIIRALKEVDAGAKAADVCRRLGVTVWACPGLVDSLFRRPAAPRGFVRSPPG